MNWYLYVKNNPVNMVDPSGMYSISGCIKAYQFAWNLWKKMGSLRLNDKWAHCVAFCRIKKECGGLDVYALGYGKEFWDWVGGQIGTYPGGTWDWNDIDANEEGANCPKKEGCIEHCNQHFMMRP